MGFSSVSTCSQRRQPYVLSHSVRHLVIVRAMHLVRNDRGALARGFDVLFGEAQQSKAFESPITWRICVRVAAPKRINARHR